MGKFHDDNDEDQYYTEQQAYDEGPTGTYAQQMAMQMKVEEKVSKHASRRQKKKGKGAGTVVCDPTPQPGGPIMGESEPTLDDL